jgi:hypothetical protein
MKLWTMPKLGRALKVHPMTVQRAVLSSGIETVTVNRSKKVRHDVLVRWLGFDPQEDPLWTLPEIARECGLSLLGVRRTVSAGRLRSVKVCARLRRVRHSDLVEWLGADPLRPEMTSPPRGQAPAPRNHPDNDRPPGDDSGTSKPEEKAQPALFDLLDRTA